jgi:hypothetical protein
MVSTDKLLLINSFLFFHFTATVVKDHTGQIHFVKEHTQYPPFFKTGYYCREIENDEHGLQVHCCS